MRVAFANPRHLVEKKVRDLTAQRPNKIRTVLRPTWLTLQMRSAVSPNCTEILEGIAGSKYGPVYNPANFCRSPVLELASAARLSCLYRCVWSFSSWWLLPAPGTVMPATRKKKNTVYFYGPLRKSNVFLPFWLLVALSPSFLGVCLLRVELCGNDIKNLQLLPTKGYTSLD